MSKHHKKVDRSPAPPLPEASARRRANALLLPLGALLVLVILAASMRLIFLQTLETRVVAGQVLHLRHSSSRRQASPFVLDYAYPAEQREPAWAIPTLWAVRFLRDVDRDGTSLKAEAWVNAGFFGSHHAGDPLRVRYVVAAPELSVAEGENYDVVGAVYMFMVDFFGLGIGLMALSGFLLNLAFYVVRVAKEGRFPDPLSFVDDAGVRVSLRKDFVPSSTERSLRARLFRAGTVVTLLSVFVFGYLIWQGVSTSLVG